MSLESRRDARESAVIVRPMLADDLDAADRVMRVAFGTFRGLPEPSAPTA